MLELALRDSWTGMLSDERGEKIRGEYSKEY